MAKWLLIENADSSLQKKTIVKERIRMDGKYIALGILIPFVGTSLGSACVYFLKGNKTTGGNAPVIPPDIEKGLTGFAAGVMVAASI